MKTLKFIITWLRKKNEFTFILLLIVLIWIFVPKLFRLLKMDAGEFGVEVLYIPLIAGIYFFIGLMFVWAYLWLVWPHGYRLLDNVFEESEKLTLWEKLQFLARIFSALILLYAVALLAVTGISAIM